MNSLILSWVLLPGGHFPLNLSTLAFDTDRPTSSRRLFLGIWRVLTLLFTEKVSSDTPNLLHYETVSTYSVSIFILPVRIFWVYTIFLLRHTFSRPRNFHHFSLSHYRSCYMLLVTIISLLHTVLVVLCLFWETVTLVPKAALTSHSFTILSLSCSFFFVLFLSSLTDVEARRTALYFHNSYLIS